MPVGGGPETLVPELEAVFNRNWILTPEGLYFVSRSTATGLELFSFTDGGIKRLVDLPVQPSPVYCGLAVSPDGRNFLYMQADVARSNLMIVNNFR